MRLSKKWGVLAVVLAIGAGGCGDDGGPGDGNLSEDEKTQIAQALGSNVPFAALVMETVGEVGKLNPGAAASARRAVDQALRLSASGIAATSYDAFGLVIELHQSATQSDIWLIGVVGWNGVTATGVDELVMVFGEGEGTVPSATSGTFEDFEVLGLYITDETNLYVATAGTAAMTSANFGGNVQDCSGSSGGFTIDCEVQVGEMSGDFEFVAENEAQQTYTQAPVEFTGLPAVRIVMTVTGG